MANRRMLSRRISQSKKVNSLSLRSQLVWTWIFPYLDDFGRYTADPEDIKTEVFPKNKQITEKNIQDSLLEIFNIGLISIYTVDEKPYQEYAKFDDFQTFRADRIRNSEYPSGDNGIPMTTTDSPKLREDKRSKEKRRYGESSLVSLTTIEHQKLMDRFGEEVTRMYIDKLNNYVGSKGKKYDSHYHTILTWIDKDAKSSSANKYGYKTQKNVDLLKDFLKEKDNVGQKRIC